MAQIFDNRDLVSGVGFRVWVFFPPTKQGRGRIAGYLVEYCQAATVS